MLVFQQKAQGEGGGLCSLSASKSLKENSLHVRLAGEHPQRAGRGAAGRVSDEPAGASSGRGRQDRGTAEHLLRGPAAHSALHGEDGREEHVDPDRWPK